MNARAETRPMGIGYGMDLRRCTPGLRRAIERTAAMSAIALTTHPEAGNPLDNLVEAYVQAKKAEDDAKKHRLYLEERILGLVPAKEEGSETTALGNGFKLTTTGKLSYKADDLEALREITRSWDGNLVPIKTTSAIDEAGCKYLRRERPDLWKQIAGVITVAPAKASLKVAV